MPENHRCAAQIIGSASTSQPSDIGEVDIPSTRTTCEGIHGNFDSKGFSGVVGAIEDPISGDLFPVTAPNESQGSKGKGPRESLIDYVTEATHFSNTHDSLLINHHTHMPNNEDHWRSVSLRRSSHDKAILPTSKSAKETVHYSLHPSKFLCFARKSSSCLSEDRSCFLIVSDLVKYSLLVGFMKRIKQRCRSRNLKSPAYREARNSIQNLLDKVCSTKAW